ncbi:aminodeoxychorismate/anthranilate synthase component II [Natrarchaeobius halalkaliphilus]|uniref:anthranilate synthase n=1 Tax=Natrarchaeobius halalkaliphilus TaxID=1679091 RepID=A0A3N6LPJ1_9EURY|nr:anthranilate synthase component II [Natrarchaeobius halalkaliphilus]RQG91398.1 aminodeoxychorismate/anthranilate synthase component II [Natrarchaeobius halalkaliphilus]
MSPNSSSNGEPVTGAETATLRVLFVDNYDSFTYNLVEYVSQLPGTETEVRKNTASLADVRAVDPDAIVISPGPGHPKNDRDVGVTMDVLRELSPDVPTLGVCLGLEATVYAYGGSVGRAPDPIHGKASAVDHDGEGVFDGLERGFRAGRYHSLVATEVPDCLEVTATADHDGTELVMGVRHREHPIECVQFHPESVLTAVGHDVIENFLSDVRDRDRSATPPTAR